MIVKNALEYVKKESATSLLQHVCYYWFCNVQKSHIQMLLMMGVRDCPEQVEVYSEVMGVAKSDSWIVE